MFPYLDGRKLWLLTILLTSACEGASGFDDLDTRDEAPASDDEDREPSDDDDDDDVEEAVEAELDSGVVGTEDSSTRTPSVPDAGTPAALDAALPCANQDETCRDGGRTHDAQAASDAGLEPAADARVPVKDGAVSDAAPPRDAGPAPNTTIFLAGDSTVQTYTAAQAPMEGWGQQFGRYLDSRATIKNYALGGRSTRTFMYNVKCVNGKAQVQLDASGKPDSRGTRWERIVSEIKSGDYLLIQFGANDNGSVCERHVDIPDYRMLLGTMAEVARAKGATPIFVTPTSQLSNRNGMLQGTLTNYAGAMKEAGRANDVQVVDLNLRTVEYYRSVGYEEARSTLFVPGQVTHFTREGAIQVARLVAQELKVLGTPLAPYVK